MRHWILAAALSLAAVGAFIAGCDGGGGNPCAPSPNISATQHGTTITARWSLALPHSSCGPVTLSLLTKSRSVAFDPRAAGPSGAVRNIRVTADHGSTTISIGPANDPPYEIQAWTRSLSAAVRRAGTHLGPISPKVTVQVQGSPVTAETIRQARAQADACLADATRKAECPHSHVEHPITPLTVSALEIQKHLHFSFGNTGSWTPHQPSCSGHVTCTVTFTYEQNFQIERLVMSYTFGGYGNRDCWQMTGFAVVRPIPADNAGMTGIFPDHPNGICRST